MNAPFSSVRYNDSIGAAPARVERLTGALELNPRIWPHLSEPYHRYILMHEAGHVLLNTSNESQVNKFATTNYLQPFRHDPAQLNHAKQQLAEITNPETTKAFDNFSMDPISAIANALNGIFTALPQLGLGTNKAMEAQQNNTYLSIVRQEQAKSEKLQTIILVAVIVFVFGAVYFTFKSKK